VDDTWLPVVLLALGALLLLGSTSARSAAAAERTRLATRLAAVERTVQAIADHLGVVVPEERHPEVERLLGQGKEIAAVKAYREATGADLLTAKRAVDELARRRS
jgi:ribosomal protein L7/L12